MNHALKYFYNYRKTIFINEIQKDGKYIRCGNINQEEEKKDTC